MFFLVDDSEMIYKLNAKIDDTLNFVLNEIYRKNRKNRISLNEINISKLKLLEKMHDLYMVLYMRQIVKY